jgi:hypothetical protein
MKLKTFVFVRTRGATTLIEKHTHATGRDDDERIKREKGRKNV